MTKISFKNCLFFSQCLKVTKKKNHHLKSQESLSNKSRLQAGRQCKTISGIINMWKNKLGGWNGAPR